MLCRQYARDRPTEGVSDDHEGSVTNLAEGRHHQFGVVAGAARRRRCWRGPESREVQCDRRDTTVGQFIRRRGEILTPTGPPVEPDHLYRTSAERLTENGSVAVGTQHVFRLVTWCGALGHVTAYR